MASATEEKTCRKKTNQALLSMQKTVSDGAALRSEEVYYLWCNSHSLRTKYPKNYCSGNPKCCPVSGSSYVKEGNQELFKLAVKECLDNVQAGSYQYYDETPDAVPQLFAFYGSK